MQLKTILNRVHKFKSFVYKTVRLREVGGSLSLEAEIEPRSNSRPTCSDCGHRGPGYDRLPMRRFEFVPLWGIKVYLLYRPRRVACERCGVRVHIPAHSEHRFRFKMNTHSGRT